MENDSNKKPSFASRISWSRISCPGRCGWRSFGKQRYGAEGQQAGNARTDRSSTDPGPANNAWTRKTRIPRGHPPPIPRA